MVLPEVLEMGDPSHHKNDVDLAGTDHLVCNIHTIVLHVFRFGCKGIRRCSSGSSRCSVEPRTGCMETRMSRSVRRFIDGVDRNAQSVANFRDGLDIFVLLILSQNPYYYRDILCAIV